MENIRQYAPGILLTGALAIISTYLAKLPYLSVLGALTMAMVLGMAWRSFAGLAPSIKSGVALSGKRLLRLGIVLMGVRLNFALVASAGPKVVMLDLAIIVVGICGIYWITQKFGLSARLGMLLAVGTSICGASAVVAAGPVTKADEDDVGLAVAMCGILGTVGVLIYVLGAPIFALAPLQMAILSGSTLHEVAQVMAAAFSWGQTAGEMGTLVKLTRVVFLAPTLLVLGALQGGGRLSYSWKEPPVPWFVIGFLMVGIVNTLGIFGPSLASTLTRTSVFLMTVAMAALGLQTDLGNIRRTGLKALAAGFAGFGLLAVLAWSLIQLLHIT